MVAELSTPFASFSEMYRPAVEAIDDLEWFANEAPAEMGQGSSFGEMLERATLEYEFCAPDQRDEHDKTSLRTIGGKPVGHYGRSFAAQPWEEWVVDPTYANPRSPDPLRREGGYARRVWGARANQTDAAVPGHVNTHQIVATEMCTNVEEVLALMPARLRQVVVMRHEPRAHERTMRGEFKDLVRIIHLSRSARAAYRDAKAARVRLAQGLEVLLGGPRPFAKADAERIARESAELAKPIETTLYAWLEGLALRASRGKSKKGEQQVMKDAKKEMAIELACGYAAYEEARARLPRGRLYPYQTEEIQLRHLNAGAQ